MPPDDRQTDPASPDPPEQGRGGQDLAALLAATAERAARFYAGLPERAVHATATVEELRAALNPLGVPEFEAAAIKGDGVFETLKGLSKLVLTRLKDVA
jgi:hypothetical protein